MENYAITKLEDRVAELENELRRIRFGSERLRSDTERLQVELRRVEIAARPKPTIIGDGFFTNIALGIGSAAIGAGGALILVGLVTFLFRA
jgi:hypothetical protein